MNPRVAAVIAAYAEGLTTVQAAERVGIKRTTARRYATAARAAGIAVPRPSLKRGRAEKMAHIAARYAQGWTPDTIGAELGIKPRSVVTYASAMRREGKAIPRAPQTGGDPRRVPFGEAARLHAEGWTQAALAARYGVTRNAVSDVLRQAAAAGIPTGPLGRWPKP